MSEKYTERECKHHGLTTFVLESRGWYRCRQCRSDGVTKRRKNVKAKLVETFGGKCKGCGYSRCIEALDFHHLDEDTKEFGIGSGNSISYDRLLEEADKCILLCATCHREVHAGYLDASTLL